MLRRAGLSFHLAVHKAGERRKQSLGRALSHPARHKAAPNSRRHCHWRCRECRQLRGQRGRQVVGRALAALKTRAVLSLLSCKEGREGSLTWEGSLSYL